MLFFMEKAENFPSKRKPPQRKLSFAADDDLIARIDTPRVRRGLGDRLYPARFSVAGWRKRGSSHDQRAASSRADRGWHASEPAAVRRQLVLGDSYQRMRLERVRAGVCLEGLGMGCIISPMCLVPARPRRRRPSWAETPPISSSCLMRFSPNIRHWPRSLLGRASRTCLAARRRVSAPGWRPSLLAGRPSLAPLARWRPRRRRLTRVRTSGPGRNAFIMAARDGCRPACFPRGCQQRLGV
jgi:hypothetical protein